jgi:Carboxypeptidase regulatory-like domain
MRRSLFSSRCEVTKQAAAGARQSSGKRRHDTRRTFAVLVGCLALFVLAPVAVAQAAVTLEGTVTAVKGGTLEGIEVTASSELGGTSGFATTNATGEYTITNLSTGEYSVTFKDPAAKYVGQEQAIVLAEGENTLNAAMQESGTISGRVTSAATGAGLGNVQVHLNGIGGEEERNVTTDDEGFYAISNLPPGDYALDFSSSESGYLSQSTTTTVVEGATDTVDVALKEGGKIAGTVTDAVSHGRLAQIEVCAFGSSGGNCASTNANGEYAVTGLPTGSYKVSFSWEYSEAEIKACEHTVQCPPRYIAQYFSNQPSEATANPVGATEGSITSGIDAAMVSSAPVNKALPFVSGVPTVGSLLSCSNGSWTGESELALTAGWPLTTPFAYQWLRDGGAIPGATSAAYLVQKADVGHGLACEVVATNAAGHASARSLPVAVTRPAVTVSSTKIVASGSAARVPVACANAACAGTIELTGKVAVKSKGKKAKEKTVVLGKGSYSLAANTKATIAVRLSAAGKSALAKAKGHKLSGKAGVTVTGGVTVQKSVVLSEAAKKPKHKGKKK